MGVSRVPGAFSIPQPACPYFQPAQADWIYPVSGYCRGLPQGLLMIPSIEEYRALCSTAQHTTCLIHRGRQGDTEAEAAAQDACRSGRPFPPLYGRERPRPASTGPAPLRGAPGAAVTPSP
jgi:hypothetical protein